MKQMIAMLLALAMLFAFAGCQASQSAVVQDPATATSAAPEAETPAAQPQEEPTLPAVETQPADLPEQGDENGDWDDLTQAYQLVETGYAYENGNYSYRLPTIHADTAGARAINEAVNAEFTAQAMESAQAISENSDPNTIVTGICSTDWFLTVWDGVISLVVSANYEGDWTEYKVYYYDMAAGTQLTKAEMLERIVLTEDEFLEGAREAARERYISQYADIPEETREQAGYYEFITMLDGDEIINMNMVEFAVDTGATITVFAPVPSLAGASYYYQMLYPTFRMG